MAGRAQKEKKDQVVGGEEGDDLVSVMAGHPDYVLQIGMITIELGNLESSLADLLGAILDVEGDVAHSIYFTAKAVIPRVELLTNVNVALHPDEELDEDEMQEIRKRLKNISGRATAVMGKRNQLLHASWGTTAGGEVYYASLPLKEDAFRRATVKELRRIVQDMHKLVDVLRNWSEW